MFEVNYVSCINEGLYMNELFHFNTSYSKFSLLIVVTTYFDNIIMALLDLAMDDVIHAFIYGFSLCLKGFIKAYV